MLHLLLVIKLVMISWQTCDPRCVKKKNMQRKNMKDREREKEGREREYSNQNRQEVLSTHLAVVN